MSLLQKSEKMSFRQAFSRNPDFNYLKRLDPRQKPSVMTIFLQEAHNTSHFRKPVWFPKTSRFKKQVRQFCSKKGLALYPLKENDQRTE